MARVLVVEDNRANMKLASLLLAKAGHSVLCAADAESGLTLARAEQPDLILMDIQLPGMDGLGATTVLKRDPATAAIPVVALTAMAMQSDREKTQAAGCDAYIAKPLRYQELYAVIDSLLVDGAPSAVREHAAANQTPAPTPLPESQDAAPSPSPSSSPSRDAVPRPTRRILIAEDNETSQKLILRQLASLGLVADVAPTGRLALERWQSGDYVLLLSDLNMPEMDGQQLTAAIREREHGSRHTVIIGMTASYDRDVAEQCRAAGMDDFLAKPLQLAALKSALDAWMPGLAARWPAPAPAPVGDSLACAQAVDVGVLKNLVGDDRQVVLEFLQDFRRTAAKISRELIAACADGQAQQACDQAHKLKSSARAVGALALGELCAQIETAGKAGRTDTLATLLPRFEHELEAVNVFLDAFAGPA